MKRAVTVEDVDELLRFLPLFEKPNRTFVETWGGGEKSPEGAITMPYPVYPPDVQEFFRLAARPCWSDDGYEPTAAATMLEDDKTIQQATIDQVRAMVTHCVRGERFCDGHWEAVLRSGKIVALLRRLQVLRADMGKSRAELSGRTLAAVFEGGGHMNVPKFDAMLRPILALSVDAPITRVSATESMALHFNLSAEDRQVRIPSGKATYVRNRTGWAMTFLTKGGLIEKVAPKQYRVTERGRAFLAAHPEEITTRDLEAIDGWEEAWNADAREGGGAQAKDGDDGDSPDTDPEIIEARIKRKIERALPEPSIRGAVLEFLAYAVENVDEERSDAWQLRETKRGFELKAGRMLALQIKPNHFGVSVVGPLSPETSSLLGVSKEDEEPWKKVAGGLYLALRPDRVAAHLGLLKDPFAQFVDAAIARVRRDVDLDDHAPEAITYLSKVVGRDLPQPEPRQASEEADEPDTDDDVAELSREPKERGRAAIFELGQRAVGSLIEDIDPNRGVIALPDLQRPFVWEDTRVRDLLDSLFIGFPVGTLVLWYTTDEREARALGASDRALRATTLVIDGQQRLTSLFAVMRGVEIQDKDGDKRLITIAFRPRDGRFEVCDAAIRKDPEFLPNVSELWCGPRTKAQIRKDILKALEERGRIIDDAYRDATDMNLDRAQGIVNYRFPTVEIRKTATAEEIGEEDVAEIFVRINSQGTRLGQADFVLTLLSVFHGALRDRIETGARSMSINAIVPVDTQQILRTACAVGFQRARMSAIYKYLRGIDPVTGDPNPAGRIERLKVLDQAVDQCLNETRWRDYMLRVMLAGFVSPGLVASTNAVANAYAFYVMGTTYGVQRQRLEEGVCRWLFGTLLTARYSTSSETKYEEDLGRVRDASKVDPMAFVQTLDDMLSDVLTNDYWNQTLPSALDTQRGRAPAALAFRAAQVILGGKALFSDQPLQNLLAAPGGGGRAASEMHHLFPKAWLHDRGITERKKVNQVANLADAGWHDNSSMGSQSPAKYVPRLRAKFEIGDDQWGRMCAEHALPPGWESMNYEEFLAARRPRMAEIIRIAFRKLGGEASASPIVPPWFLPGAEVVWQRIGDVELKLRAIVREVYRQRFGDQAAAAVEGALDARERDVLARAARNRPAGADGLGVVDYLYLAQLPALLFKPDVWQEARARLGGDAETKRRLQIAIDHITPVRNEIAHVREVAPEKLQRANLACADVLAMLSPG